MGAAVRSDAAVSGVVPVVSPEAALLGAFPAAVSQAAVHPEVLPAVTRLEGSPAVVPLDALQAVAFRAAVSLAAMVEVGTVNNSI